MNGFTIPLTRYKGINVEEENCSGSVFDLQEREKHKQSSKRKELNRRYDIKPRRLTFQYFK